VCFILRLHYTTYKILKTMALDTTAFNSLWMNADNISKTKKEFIEASNLTGGFPTLVLTKDGQPEALASGYFTKEIMIQKLHQLK
jgi:protein-disulfide isomerase-like protein with CxxC motif